MPGCHVQFNYDSDCPVCLRLDPELSMLSEYILNSGSYFLSSGKEERKYPEYNIGF